MATEPLRAGRVGGGLKGPSTWGGSGRPPKPVHQRILKAALEEIAEVGVDAFSLSRCARRAHVSKPSIYLRWSNTEELIAAALASLATWPVVADLGAWCVSRA
jgi:AcrR family transcriptional regulator